jgi:hypothetical protein
MDRDFRIRICMMVKKKAMSIAILLEKPGQV